MNSRVRTAPGLITADAAANSSSCPSSEPTKEVQKVVRGLEKQTLSVKLHNDL